MQRALWILSGLLLTASCGEDVPVGGRDDDGVTNDDDGDPATGDGDGDGDDTSTGDGDPATDDDNEQCDGELVQGRCVPPTDDDDPSSDDDDETDVDAGTDVRDPIDEAIDQASDDVRCQDASDCCVVIDQCRGIGLVVWPQDQPSVRDLIDSAGQDECVQCGATYVQLTCEQNVCVGTSVTPSPISNGPTEDPLAQDHCGSVQSFGEREIESGHVLGCGLDGSGNGAGSDR
jgi:hypothetical protein